jgi:hypothetical protein
MVQKIPPPPFLTGPEYEGLNRWLLELTSLLNDAGGIDPGSVAGLSAVIEQSAANSLEILALQASTGDQSGAITVLQNEVAALTTSIATINSSITTLGARAQVFNGIAAPGAGLGVDNDWFYNRVGAVGFRLYIKVAGAWVPQAI